MRGAWLDRVPEAWPIVPLGAVSGLMVPMRDKPKDLDGPIPWVRIEDLKDGRVSKSRSGQGVTPETVSTMNLKVFPRGTVMCTCSCSMGTTAIVEAPLVSNQTFIGVVPGPRLKTEFLYYLMIAAKLELNALGTGAIQQYLSRNDFSTFRIPLPTVEMQSAIADFLDRETEWIDRLVEKKRRLIELLEEKRTALISHAVTKGLDPTVPMKDSGIPWLGSVPKHWEVTKIGRIARLASGVGFPDAFQGLDDEELPFYKVSDMNTPGNERYMNTAANTVSRRTAAELGGRIVGEGAILFPKVGAAMLTNKRRILTVPSLFDNNTMALHLRRGQPEYFHLLLEQVDFAEIAQHGPVPSISAGVVREVRVPLPPTNEQRQIVAHIDDKTAPVGAAARALTHQLEKLAEYRQALITAAVTGQIDVTPERANPEDAVA